MICYTILHSSILFHFLLNPTVLLLPVKSNNTKGFPDKYSGKPFNKRKLHFIKGYVHLRCPACGAEYQLDTGSLKKYMLIPLLSVAAAVGTSLRFLQGRTIDIKCIYILTVSFVLSGLLGTLCVKTGLLTYEEKENR